MLVSTRIVLGRLLALLSLLVVLTQCESLTRFKPESKANAAKESGGDAEEAEDSEKDDDEAEQEIKNDDEPKDAALEHVIAVDQTPFFRWLRSGLRSNSTPSRFLDKGTRVELLKENEDEKFSRIRLPDKKKGWVPSRLVKKQNASEAATNSNEPAPKEVESPTTPSAETNLVPPVSPAQLPGPDTQLPAIPLEDLPDPIMIDYGIETPKSSPKEKEPDPAEAKKDSAASEPKANVPRILTAPPSSLPDTTE